MSVVSQGDPSRPYTMKLVRKTRIAQGILELAFERPADFTFTPGQRIRLIHERGERDYSPTSSPEDFLLVLLIKVVRGGALTPVLSRARRGEVFSFTGPHGYFVWLPSGRQAVFVATGTGVAPFLSMAGSGVTGFIMIHGVRRAEELCRQSLLRKAAKDYVVCISGPSSAEEAHSFPGRVTAYLETRLHPGSYDFYLCGQREMIRDVVLIVDNRFPGSSVYTETFY